MFISYESDEIRECCLLLGNTNIDSRFTIDEIKVIRSIIADLKAAPRLTDLPLKYTFDRDEGIIDIEYGILKIICKSISTILKPSHDKIERLKIMRIINVKLEEDLDNKKNQAKF